MTGAAFVDPAAIDEAARALVRYGAAEESVMAQVVGAIQATTQRVHSELHRRVQELAAAEAALQACLACEDADCSGLAAAVRLAQTRVDTARQASREVNAATGRYQPVKSKHSSTVQALVQNGRAHLNRNAQNISTYLGAGSAGGGASGDGPGASGGANGGGACGGSGLSTPAGFPSGWAMVPISSIDTSASTVHGPGDFGKGYTPEDLSWAFGALHDVVIPALALGKDGDYFAERDQRDGLMGTRSYHMTWSQFFGSGDSIRLDRQSDGRLNITNGQHRIWVAQQRGETSIPAWVAP